MKATELVSVGLEAKPANGRSTAADLSFDGRFVVFVSFASNLVTGDTNRAADIFVRDRLRGTTERVSLSSGGKQANRASDRPHISANGRFVAFRSGASNLVLGDTNRRADAFVHDRRLGTTVRVSVAGNGRQGDRSVQSVAISGNGRFVAFSSRAGTLDRRDRGHLLKIFLHDRRNGTTRALNLGDLGRANGDSHASAISNDGRFVAFRSHASNLVAGDTNAVADAFVRDRRLGRTIRLSVSSTGEQGDLHSFRPHLSASGRFAVFRSYADNLVGGDTNAVIDVFVRDLARGQTIRVSMSSAGEQANERPLILPCISGDGRRVVFGSLASNLVGGDTNRRADVFLYDRRTGGLRRVSIGMRGRQANGASERARISGNGRTIVFPSRAGNLVAGDRNGRTDIFVRSLTI